MGYEQEYKSKLTTPEEAVKIVKNGDWIDYGAYMGFPVLLDAALAKRKNELSDIKVRGLLMDEPLQIIEQDPERETFIYNSWHLLTYERRMCDKGLCNFIPML
ncbi:MAG: butyryl-CoA:acetate CoA-transferase, partial [Mogibacterium sp.]|nr:butyryl-CoA:acetate CoA-transferase [Mogibacterium sp.]